MKKNPIKKTLEIIRKNTFLRILSISNIFFIIFIISSLILSVIFHNKITENIENIEKNKKALQSLETLVDTEDEAGQLNSDILINKSFAGYDEVIPFIALLESLFSTIDPKADITIKSREQEIFIDKFADYKINLDINNKSELFFQAFNELYNSRFITKIMNFSMNYKTMEESNLNELKEAEFTIRLFLN